MVDRIAVAATAPFGADVLERLAATHEVTALLTRPDAPAGRGRNVAAPPAKAVAEGLGIPVLQPERPAVGLDLGAPTVVVCAYGLLIPTALLAERTWLNVHPSLLPRWRGAAPVERAIMAGDPETWVTIHETDDAGDVFARAAEVAARLLDSVLAEPAPAFRPQEGEPTYAEKIGPDDRLLDLTRPAEELVRVVRALSPHIGARAELEGRRVTVWHARVGDDGGFEPLEVQPEGGRRMEVTAWRRGLR